MKFDSVNIMTEIVQHVSEDDPLWVPLTKEVQLRPLMFDCSNGAWSNLLRVTPGGSLACHYHTAPVHAFVVAGAWRYLEHDWLAETGSFIYEPPGEVHTLVADEKRGMTTFFVTRGSLIYTDKAGKQIGYEDVFTRLARFREHLAESGLDQTVADHLIR
jgi:2,4'-dihydroxyacetophenone dioxygenase